MRKARMPLWIVRPGTSALPVATGVSVSLLSSIFSLEGGLDGLPLRASHRKVEAEVEKTRGRIDRCST